MLQGKTALVTGATRGIGRAIVNGLAENGCRVVLCSRTEGEASKLADELRDEKGWDVHGTSADVTSQDSIASLIGFALETSQDGAIDILVNNAGRPGGGPTKDIQDDLWYDVIETNLNSVFRVTREVLRRGQMLERSEGRVINIASTGGKQGVPLGAPYSASKHGVVGFSKALGNELGKTGVTVNAVCPGFVETEMAEHVRENYARIWNTTPEKVLEKFQLRIPTGRYVEPHEVSELVVFLSSTGAKSITSQAINVCGGLGNY